MKRTVEKTKIYKRIFLRIHFKNKTKKWNSIFTILYFPWEILTKSGEGSGWGHDGLRSKSRLWPLSEARPGADLCTAYLLVQQAYFDTAFQRLIED